MCAPAAVEAAEYAEKATANMRSYLKLLVPALCTTSPQAGALWSPLHYRAEESSGDSVGAPLPASSCPGLADECKYAP